MSTGRRRARTMAACAAASAAFAGGFAASSPSPAARDSGFDLAVQEVDVRQTASTPMFREVMVKCVVQNRGPSLSRGSEILVISRPGDDGPKILKTAPIPVPLARGEKFVLAAEGAAWFASTVPYRCEIQWDGSNPRRCRSIRRLRRIHLPEVVTTPTLRV